MFQTSEVIMLEHVGVYTVFMIMYVYIYLPRLDSYVSQWFLYGIFNNMYPNIKPNVSYMEHRASSNRPDPNPTCPTPTTHPCLDLKKLTMMFWKGNQPYMDFFLRIDPLPVSFPNIPYQLQGHQSDSREFLEAGVANPISKATHFRTVFFSLVLSWGGLIQSKTSNS